jgi:GNAT superfamily N-acetyltransferase
MSDAISCAVSGFAGMEQEILRLRNTNRDNSETAAYLSWRYQSAPGALPPRVYWLLTAQGERIGMAAAIFRPYWVQGTLAQVAVIGDISLDARWRGRGLGQQLLRFMTQHLDENFPAHPALVIPTESARRALEHCGWATAGSLAPWVCVVDAADYLRPFTRSTHLARALARVARAGSRAFVGRHVPRDGTLQVSDLPDTSIREAVRAQAAAGVATRDLNAQVLGWRYTRHPHTAFRFATLSRAGVARAFLAFEESTHPGTCVIYDLWATSAADARALLALFMRRALMAAQLKSVRVLLDERHPWRAELPRVGFIARPAEAVFQVHSRDGSAARLDWQLSQGDKDT